MAATMKKVTSTTNMTGFASMDLGFRRTKESTRVFLVIMDGRLGILTLRSIATLPDGSTKEVHHTLQVCQDWPKHEEGEEGQDDQQENASNEHRREDDAVSPQAHFGGPLSSDHRSSQGKEDSYGQVAPGEDYEGGCHVEERRVGRGAEEVRSVVGSGGRELVQDLGETNRSGEGAETRYGVDRPARVGCHSGD